MDQPVPKSLTIVARIQAKAGQEGMAEAELHKLIEPSRRDRGCLEYVMHASLETPGLFLFYENWETKADWEAHMETEHLQEWKAVAADLAANVEIMQMEKIG